MPLTDKGEKIKRSMEEEYGPDKGEKVFYASKNKGTIKGVDAEDSRLLTKAGNAKDALPTFPRSPQAPTAPVVHRSGRDQMITAPSAGAPLGKPTWPGRVV